MFVSALDSNGWDGLHIPKSTTRASKNIARTDPLASSQFVTAQKVLRWLKKLCKAGENTMTEVFSCSSTVISYDIPKKRYNVGCLIITPP